MIKEGIVIGGRYEIMGRIGTGGMADVYKARDYKLNRYVAVKVLKREFREDVLFVKKFQSEAQSAAGLTHPNVVNVYDVGEDRGLYYIVMELVEGITLKDYVQKKGQLTPKEVISIMVQVCEGIESAHNNNIIHRDIKPQNIIISKEGKVKVTDFGIAKAISSNTISTNAMGSVHYTSPEQARGGFSDAKSDVYSLGITMYEMITGHLPFDGDSTVSIALKHLQEDITEPSEFVPDIPYSLERIILKCTQKSPDRRYPSVALLERDLKRSMVEPDGDFVSIAPITTSDTVKITQEELSRIQREANFNTRRYEEDRYEDDDYEDYEDDERYRRHRAEKKEDMNPKMAKLMKILAIVAAVIFVGVLVFAVGTAVGIFKIGPGMEAPVEEKGIVPKLVGVPQEEAEKLCAEQGLTLKVKETKESEKYEKGVVTWQSSQEGVKLPEGGIVQVSVSSKCIGEPATVPDVRGMTKDKAHKALLEAGFKKANITVRYENNKDVEAGKVIGTNPAAKTETRTVVEIEIIVSEGIKIVKVPKLVDRTKADAEKLLKDAGLVGVAIEEETEDTFLIGSVLSQSIDEGENVNEGTTIKYSVGVKKAEKVKIPTNLVGGGFDDAVYELKDRLGLNVKEDPVETKDINLNGVVKAVEKSGQEVSVGTTVKVTYYVYKESTSAN